jgi:hypothetical protein
MGIRCFPKQIADALDLTEESVDSIINNTQRNILECHRIIESNSILKLEKFILNNKKSPK